MSLIGKTLGHYSVSTLIGRGGMGEVYQAKDQKLGRDVAIKVLPEEFARDADRVARFQREAKLLASLNHPNIAAIYGLEEFSGTSFLVLELVEGETLADRIKAGPIPVEESLKLALQIAEALEAAHEKGVIHRDLKPANIKVTPDGKVKVLDFGLAKAFAGDREEANLSNSPTMSGAATQQGVILGTAAYMSPEQAKGKTVDKRADIWAFGTVLFEMLTGKAAFPGEEVSEILASVIKGDANLDLLPANIHPRVWEVLTRCLQKDLKKRYPDIANARYEIEQVLADPNGVFVQPTVISKPRKKMRVDMSWIALAIAITAIIVGISVWYLKPSEPRQIVRFDYELPEGQQFSNLGIQTSLAVSPDGKQIVYSTPKGLYLRFVDELNAKLIAGTEGDTRQPFFSPDGKWIGYFSPTDRQLKKISINGGVPMKLCSISALYGVSWNVDNTIVYGQAPGDIMRVSASGSTPESLVKAKTGATLFPHVLPDGKSLLYSDAGAPAQGHVMARSLKSAEAKGLFPGFVVGYLRTGHIIYAQPNDDNLYAIPFDPDTLEVEGEYGPVCIIKGVMGHGMQSAVSDAGTLVYIQGTSVDSSIQRTLVWVNRHGKEEPVSAQPNDYHHPAISPDGTRLAITKVDGANYDIWVWDFLRESWAARLTRDTGIDVCPVWTPDGKKVVFTSSRRGGYSIYWKAADGTEEDEELASLSGRQIFPWSWSKDGETLILQEQGGSGLVGIGTLSMRGEKAVKPLLQEDYYEGQPAVSPDGRWMAYQSDEFGRREIYVCPFPNVNKGKWKVSTDGGSSPLWSPNSLEICYRNDDSVMAVSIKTEPTFSVGKPEKLFSGTYVTAASGDVPPWAISPDGKRFLMLKPAQPAGKAPASEAPRRITIVVNWLEELKRHFPAK
jgi:eukaryotic-like serine/threonine-protein kinase